MSKERMQALLLISFLVVLGVTVCLTIYVTILTVGSKSTPQHWKFLYFCWSGVLLEVVSFLIALARNLFGLRADELARGIANKWAQEVVREANGDVDSLSTAYWDTKRDLQREFRVQGASWLGVLDQEFRHETESEAHRIEGLKDWTVPEEPVELDPVDEETP